MITLNAVFWMLVIVFGAIGAVRGWAKELLVTFSAILGLFVVTVLEEFVPFVSVYLAEGGSEREFALRAIIILAISFFGYQTPNIQRLSEVLIRERFQDSLLGLFIGLLNGYLVVGSVLFYMDSYGYPYDFLFPPVTDEALTVFQYLPPELLGIPAVYFAVAIAFTFVVVVLI